MTPDPYETAIEEAVRQARAAVAAGPAGYNGWANRETWTVHQWLSAEQTFAISARVAAAKPEEFAEVAMRELVDLIIGGRARNHMRGDLIGAALARVDWPAIIEAFAPEGR
jgi:aryl-alcohol dehydrogenase-like predicted oxidoreductase